MTTNEVTIEGLLEADTSKPLLSEGVYKVSVTNVRIEPNKAGTGNNLNIQLRLEQEGNSIRGDKVYPGFVLFDIISLTRTEKYDPAKRVALFQECFLGGREQPFNAEHMLGKTGMAKVSIQSSEGYPDKNSVRYLK